MYWVYLGGNKENTPDFKARLVLKLLSFASTINCILFYFFNEFFDNKNWEHGSDASAR